MRPAEAPIRDLRGEFLFDQPMQMLSYRWVIRDAG